jgi:ferric iron reductase protein FhuF
MTTLTNDQIRQLNMYSTYVSPAAHQLFTLEQAHTIDILPVIKTVTNIEKSAVAASYFMRRYGMFISTQFVMLITYEEMWMGKPSDIQFGAILEYGNMSVSTFVSAKDYHDISSTSLKDLIHLILHDEVHSMILTLRNYSSISPLTLWENVFGFLLWHFHVLLNNPSTADKARQVLNLLKEEEMWHGISSQSLFKNYLKGYEPSQVLNTKVRTTCCFSKDVPGLQACGFCPLP